MGDGGGGGVGDAEGSGDGGLGDNGGGIGSMSHGSGISSMSHRGGISSMSHGGGVGGYGGVSESDGVITDACVVLADAGESGVHGLRVVGHSGVSVQAAHCALVGSADGGGVDAGVAVSGGGVTHSGGGVAVSHSGGSQVAGVGYSDEGGEDNKLEAKRVE